MSVLAYLGILCLVIGSSVGQYDQEEDSYHSVSPMAMLDTILLADNYDKRVLPNYEHRKSFVVGISAYVLDVESVDMMKMEMTMNMYFRQFWNDPRLAFERRPGLDKIVGGEELVERLWTPDTFQVNKRLVEPSNTFARILDTGDVLWSQLIKVKFSCPMDFRYFPYDNQLCSLEIESFGHTMSDFKYKFNDGSNSVQMSSDVGLPQYKVVGHRQRVVEASLSSGNYSRLIIDIQLSRSSGYYNLSFFTPVSVLVMITWISFWVSPAHPAAKLALLVPPLIIILGVIGMVQFLLVPSLSYTTSLIIYTYMSLFMILLAFIPFVLVTILHSFFKDKSEAKNVKFWTHPVFITDTICKFLFPVIYVIIQYYFFKYHTKHDDTVQDLIYLDN